MKLKSIETRDELGLVAFGPRSRVFEVGVSSTAELYLDLPNRIVWLRAAGQEVAHGIPLEQVRRFTPLAVCIASDGSIRRDAEPVASKPAPKAQPKAKQEPSKA